MAEVKIVLEVDDKGSIKVKQFGDESKKAFDEMKKGPQAAQGPLNSLKESWIGLTAKVAAATAAVYAVSKAFSSFVNEAAEAEQIENRLRYALETTGYTWQYAKQAVDEFANSVQKSTRFSDEQARQALTNMMLYTNDFAKAQMGAKLAMDMSIRTGQDLHSTSRLIGMAMSGNVEMLGRYIPELKQLDERLGSNATMAERSAYAMKILQEKFGGTARADLDSYTAIVAQFDNSWKDLKETLGMYLLPTLKEVFVWFRKLIDIANEWAGKGKPETFLGKLRTDLKEAERSISVYEEFLRQAETAKPGTPYRLGPEATQEAKERLYMWKDWARYLKEQIEAEEKLLKGRIAAETKKDTFSPEKTKELELYKGYLIEIWQAEDKYNEESRQAADFIERKVEAWLHLTDAIKKNQEVLDKLFQLEDQYNYESEQTADFINRKTLAILRSEQAIDEYIDANQRAREDLLKTTTDLEAIWESVGQNLSSAWASNMTNIVRSTESTSEKIKSFFQSIADTFLSAISKMIANWLIFGNLTGQSKEKGGGWGGVVGVIGSVLGVALKHGGGIVGEPGPTRSVPAAAFAFAPRFHTGFMPNEYPAILKKGEGVFTPDQMKALGGDTHTYYIDARGSQKGVSIEIMRAIKESENKAVVRSVNQVADAKLRGGKFAKIFKD